MGIFSIGHGNCEIEEFARLLDSCGVQVLVDVRSAPYSKYATQFNRERLEDYLENKTKIKYVYRGRELGGFTDKEEYLTPDKKPDYDKMRKSPDFISCLDMLIEFATEEKKNIAIMCSEEDPEYCHRNLLIGDYIFEKGLDIMHIRRGGSLISHSGLKKRRVLKQVSLNLSFG